MYTCIKYILKKDQKSLNLDITKMEEEGMLGFTESNSGESLKKKKKCSGLDDLDWLLLPLSVFVSSW